MRSTRSASATATSRSSPPAARLASRTASAARSGSAMPGSARTRCACAEAEAALAGQPATAENFAKAAATAAEHVRPTSDVHADEAYRRDLVRALTSRVLAAALARCA